MIISLRQEYMLVVALHNKEFAGPVQMLDFLRSPRFSSCDNTDISLTTTLSSSPQC